MVNRTFEKSVTCWPGSPSDLNDAIDALLVTCAVANANDGENTASDAVGTPLGNQFAGSVHEFDDAPVQVLKPAGTAIIANDVLPKPCTDAKTWQEAACVVKNDTFAGLTAASPAASLRTVIGLFALHAPITVKSTG